MLTAKSFRDSSMRVSRRDISMRLGEDPPIHLLSFGCSPKAHTLNSWSLVWQDGGTLRGGAIMSVGECT